MQSVKYFIAYLVLMVLILGYSNYTIRAANKTTDLPINRLEWNPFSEEGQHDPMSGWDALDEIALGLYTTSMCGVNLAQCVDRAYMKTYVFLKLHRSMRDKYFDIKEEKEE